MLCRRRAIPTLVELDVKVKKKVMIVEQQYDEKHENGDTHGFYTLKLKACNPGCS